MIDPFLIEGPALVSFSGGRTSAYMLRRILDAHGDALPDDVFVVFADTGKERPETYHFVDEIQKRWLVEIHKVERPGGFEQLIKDRSGLPNGVARWCTGDLKIKPMRAFMRARGFKWWAMVVGIRADEPARVAKMRGIDGDSWDHSLPLAAAGITEDDVMGFWLSQDFDLKLKQHEGNCDLCFLKSKRKLLNLMAARPGMADWWVQMENLASSQFNLSHTYAQLLAISQELAKQQALPFDVDVRHISKMGRAPAKKTDLSAQLNLLLDDTDTKPCMCGD